MTFFLQTGFYRRAAAQGGFTLLEILVAVTILALALATLFGTFSSGLTLSHRSENNATLALATQSKLAEVGRSIPLEIGEWRGDYEDGGSWHLQIEEVSGSEARSAVGRALRLYRVSLQSEREGGGRVHLSTMRLAQGLGE